MRNSALRFAYLEVVARVKVDVHHQANAHIGALGTNQDPVARNSTDAPNGRTDSRLKSVANRYYLRYRW